MRRISLLFALALVGCSDDSSPNDGTATADTGADVIDAADTGGTTVEAVCTDGTSWDPGTPIYREVTDEAGLTEAGAMGVRVNVGDIDGDGWPDLLLRRGGSRLESYAEDGVRRTWLLRNEGGLFVDITRDSGLVDTRVDYGEPLGRPVDVPAFADVDNDGDLDVYTGVQTADSEPIGGEISELMINNGEGVFSFTRRDNPIRRDGEVDAPAGASFVDVDRDGCVDLWLGQHNYTDPSDGSTIFQHDRLFLGDCDGGFVDATAESGLVTAEWVDLDDLDAGRAHSRSWSAAACDLNGDGTPELLAASYGRAPNHLWQGARAEDGSVTFTNRSVDSGYAYDDDFTWQNNQFAMCYCRDNPDAEGCDEAGDPAVVCQNNWRHDFDRNPFRLGGNSGATVCADLNNDGHLDLVTTEIKHWWAGDGSDGSSVLFNTGANDVTFDRPARADIGLEVPHVTSGSWDEGHMTATTFDFDNDGWLDIYIGGSDYAGNRGLLYHQHAPGEFRLVPTEDHFEHNRSHGVAALDYDRDGDLDLLVGHSRARCDANQPNNCYDEPAFRLFENIIGDAGNFVQLRLEGGEGSNRAAIGARVTVTAGGVTQTQEVGGGYGHYGAQNDLVLHFGLGTACDAEITVRWPDADLTEQSFTVVAGHRFEVTQGQDPVVANGE